MQWDFIVSFINELHSFVVARPLRTSCECDTASRVINITESSSIKLRISRKAKLITSRNQITLPYSSEIIGY